jgi:5-(carboxyamino)imidazole ribonucleotide synthase
MTRIGILGGGQLGRMIAIAAHQLGFFPYIFTDDKNAPAIEVTKNYIVANYLDQSALLHFAECVDIVTFEFENIPFKTLEILEKNCKVSPNINVFKIAQNRILEKNFFRSKNIQTAKFKEINNINDLYDIEFPVILKTAAQGYDGKGQILLRKKEEINTLEDFQFPAIAENIVDFKKELSIIIARNENNIIHFPIAENIHSEGILMTSKVPAEIDKNVKEEIIQIGINLANDLDLIGLITIEFFLTNNNEIIANEIAPRPHNSGHWSMDCCDIDQFQALILAITNNKMKQPNLIYPCIMENFLGDSINSWKDYLLKKNHKVYVYGKTEIKDKRKMGHVNILLSD